jgi:hypothetical protein
MAVVKKFTVLIVIIFVSLQLFGQSVHVKKEISRINGEAITGDAVDLEGTVKEVVSSFTKYLKTLGKVKQSGDYLTLSEIVLNDKVYGLPIFALTKDKEHSVQVWIGIKVGEKSSAEAVDLSQQLEKVMYNYCVQFYRDKVQDQIDESNQALQAVERQKQRLDNQNSDLATKLENNKLEKIQLEKSIENNKLMYETFLKKIDKNKKDQDSVQFANDQIKRVIEMQKEKQSKIN